jgi:putative transcriptional regulator
MPSLAGQLLLASRRLADPNFFHSVILLVQHGDDGALGLVLNRPLEMTVKQACDDSLEVNCEADSLLHQGGPCDGPLMALHAHVALPGHIPGAHSEVIDGLYFSTERDELEWLLRQSNPKAKFFVGYSGWSAGQLEREIAIGSWLIADANLQRVFDPAEAQQWTRLVTQLTMGQRINSDLIPDDPSVN